MRFANDQLPRSLSKVESGLEFLNQAGGFTLPLACKKLPVFDDPKTEIGNLPVMSNFARVVLDMDKEEDRDEYERIMNYNGSGYGMRIVYHERKFIKKSKTANGKTIKRIVQRIFLEYYAPYRISG